MILKISGIKNSTCYYFDEIIRSWDRDIDFSDVFLGKNWIKKNTNIL